MAKKLRLDGRRSFVSPYTFHQRIRYGQVLAVRDDVGTALLALKTETNAAIFTEVASSTTAQYDYTTRYADATAVVTQNNKLFTKNPAGAKDSLVELSITAGSGGGTVTPSAPVSVPAQESVWVTPSQMTVGAGTATFGAVNNLPVIRLPATGTTQVLLQPDLAMGTGYEVYAWISGDAANAGTPNLVGMDLQVAQVGAAISGGSTKYMLFNTTATANIPSKHQLPLGILKVDDGVSRMYSLRFDRRGDDSTDTFAGNLQIHGIEFVPVAPPVEGVTKQGADIPVTVYPTPWDGNAVLRGLAIYTPIWSMSDGILVAEPVTLQGQQQSRAAKLDLVSKAPLADVQLGTTNHDGVVGHRDSSICVDASGTYIAHGELHHSPWIGKAGPTLASLAAITAPAGASVACSYRRFFRNPYNGDIWMAMRGDSYYGGIYKWNSGTGSFDRRPTASMIGGNGSTVGYYGMEVAFASATTVYATVEPIRVTSGGMSGYPRQNIGVIKSTDGGASWTSLDGRALTLPLSPSGEGNVAFPTFNNLHQTVAGRIGVNASGQPVVVATWKHPSESVRGLWAATLVGDRWVRRRLAASLGTYGAGNPHLINHQDGEIIVVAATSDDHDNGSSADGVPGATGAERVPENNKVRIFRSKDGINWTMHNIVHPDGGYGGAYLDPEAIRLHGVVRMMPRLESDPTKSVIWEAAWPAFS